MCVDLNAAVLTTRDIFHEYEADSNFMVVSLDEILDKDSSINTILNLPLGFLASRNSLHDIWSIKRVE